MEIRPFSRSMNSTYSKIGNVFKASFIENEDIIDQIKLINEQ